jgi:predicted ABC-type ATPase
VPDTAKAIRENVSVSRAAATMLARTDLISLANGGSHMAARMVFEEGTASKKWLNAEDARVRPTHSAAGGQVVPLEGPFRVGGFELMYPGDPQGPPAEVINCRCTFTVEDVTEAAAEEGIPIRTHAIRQASDVSDVPKGEMAQRIFGDAPGTEALFSQAGVWSEARRPLHQQIVADALREGSSVLAGVTPRTMFLAGGSGAGKTTILKSLENLPKRAVKIDPDDIKTKIPEYRQMVEAFDRYAAVGVHEESSAISKQLLVEANQRRMNVLIDGTGDAGPGKFAAKIRAQQAEGHDVEVVLVDVPTEVAIERVNARAVKTGRHIAESVVREIHQVVAVRFSEWRDITDWQVWASEGTPKLIARRLNGVESVYDAERFQQMLDKADG